MFACELLDSDSIKFGRLLMLEAVNIDPNSSEKVKRAKALVIGYGAAQVPLSLTAGGPLIVHLW